MQLYREDTDRYPPAVRTICTGLCAVLVIAGLPRPSWASGEKASAEEVAKYAALEAASPDAGSFEGGAPPNALWIGLAVACILVIGIYWLFVDPNRIKPGS